MVYRVGNMKKLLLLSFICFSLLPLSAYAEGYSPSDTGYIYTNTVIPLATSKENNDVKNTIPVSKKMKSGESKSINVFGLVEWGDASVNKAVANGQLTKISHVDSKIERLFVPMGILPVYFKILRTTVYGE